MGNALIPLFHSEKNGRGGDIFKERRDVVKIITGYVLPCYIKKNYFLKNGYLKELPMFYLQKHDLHVIIIMEF